MKIISANFKLMGAPDRDQQYAHKTLREINKMLQVFPDSDFVPIAKRLKIEVEENLALGDLGVGQFYVEKANYAGARGRFQEIVKEYHSFSGLDDVYFRLAGILEKSNNPDEAAIYYSKIAVGYPFSKFFEEAKNRLKLLGKTVPSVDTQLAALNQSRIKRDDGFSPLKPFIEFGKALGFVGSTDQYAEAKKTIAAEKIKSAEAVAAKGAEGSPTADDIQIETVLRKDASGVTRDTTKLGTSSVASTQSSADKKKNSDKKKKKKIKRDL
jgi:tetratricopeptide (TPR) repeat protein